MRRLIVLFIAVLLIGCGSGSNDKKVVEVVDENIETTESEFPIIEGAYVGITTEVFFQCVSLERSGDKIELSPRDFRALVSQEDSAIYIEFTDYWYRMNDAKSDCTRYLSYVNQYGFFQFKFACDIADPEDPDLLVVGYDVNGYFTDTGWYGNLDYYEIYKNDIICTQKATFTGSKF